MNKPRLLIIISVVIFFILLSLGFNLASHKHPWGDEIYSLKKIARLSYSQILFGIKGEGNTCPLFYLIQKAVLDISQYEIPQEWDQGNWEARDLKSALILRINPVISIALAVTFIFFYFSRFHSIWSGLYGFAVSLSSYMLWLYWAEARPYSLWFLLTTCQSLILLSIFRGNENRQKSWRCLTVIHVLLSLTVILGLGQIMAASALLWFFKERNWRKYLIMTGIPAGISIFYYAIAHLDPTYVPDNIWKLILPVFPREWMFILGLYAIWEICMLQKKSSQFNNISLKEGRGYLLFVILMILVTSVILIIFKLRSPAQPTGVELSIRYLINLTPIGIIATTIFSINIINSFSKLRWIQFNVIMGLIGLIVISFFRNAMWVIGIY